MKNLIYILILALWACESRPPNNVPAEKYRKVFATDSRNELETFVPNQAELKNFEKELKRYLEDLTNSGNGFKRNVLDKVHPLEYSLGWFKRRYFGRIENENRKIYVELVSVRCGGSGEWKLIDYPTELNTECWWSADYDIDKNKIQKINYS